LVEIVLFHPNWHLIDDRLIPGEHGVNPLRSPQIHEHGRDLKVLHEQRKLPREHLVLRLVPELVVVLLAVVVVDGLDAALETLIDWSHRLVKLFNALFLLFILLLELTIVLERALMLILAELPDLLKLLLISDLLLLLGIAFLLFLLVEFVLR